MYAFDYTNWKMDLKLLSLLKTRYAVSGSLPLESLIYNKVHVALKQFSAPIVAEPW